MYAEQVKCGNKKRTKTEQVPKRIKKEMNLELNRRNIALRKGETAGLRIQVPKDQHDVQLSPS
jgi:hypothetical protein